MRLEVRLLERGPLRGGIYSAQPIAVGRPVWRADLLESVDNPGKPRPGPPPPDVLRMGPVPRVFEPELSADPVGWVGTRLSDLDGLLEAAGVDAGEVGPADADALRAAVPEILDVVRRLLDRVRAGGAVDAAPGEDGRAASAGSDARRRSVGDDVPRPRGRGLGGGNGGEARRAALRDRPGAYDHLTHPGGGNPMQSKYYRDSIP